MKVLVCGSRNWDDRNAVLNRIAELHGEHRDLAIIEGGARGADRHARIAARLFRLPLIEMSANWSKHGRAAGFVRNAQMLDMKPDLVLAFQRDGSRGTQHTINEAHKRGIPVEVHAA